MQIASAIHTFPKIPSGVASLLESANRPPVNHTTPLKTETCENPPYLSSIAPLIGGPISTANADTPMPIPIYVPMFRGSFVQSEIAVDAAEMIVPETKPKKTE